MTQRPLLPHQRGAALLTAMIVVALVAVLSATALWQQWRAVDIETAQRQRQQSDWILWGALDWARIILRKSSTDSTVDHLGEAWAVPLQDARLSSFLSTTGSSVDDPALDLFLSGHIEDLQGRLNVRNLVNADAPDPGAVEMFGRLFDLLQLPGQELSVLQTQLRAALRAAAPPTNTASPSGNTSTANAASSPAPLLPQRVDQLGWLGLSAATIARLAPYICILPERTPVNLNTASDVVLQAAIGGMALSDIQAMTNTRAQAHFTSVVDAASRLPAAGLLRSSAWFSVNSHYFEVQLQVRYDGQTVQELAAVQRNGGVIMPLWRQRARLQGSPAPSSLQ